MSKAVSPSPHHIRSAKVFTFSPSFHHHTLYFQSRPLPCPAKPTTPMDQVVKNAFISDFDQHCKRIVPAAFPYLTRTDLEELMVDLHFVSGSEWRETGKELVERLWERTREPGSGLAEKEIVRKIVMEIVGVEKGGMGANVQREFRSLATNRLRYLHLQAHAITRPGSASPSPPHTSPASPRPPKPRPSPRPLATVKVNLTPQKSDTITVYLGDDLTTLSRDFAVKHCLSPTEAFKLHSMLDLKLKSAARQ